SDLVVEDLPRYCDGSVTKRNDCLLFATLFRMAGAARKKQPEPTKKHLPVQYWPCITAWQHLA
ncbi:hypothetical protein, partial [Desulfovibrio piger]|uniref:hypothetical protein n=1 Tax=Desulfovibrio piger TaxID=901 RepID=UPI00307E6EFE